MNTLRIARIGSALSVLLAGTIGSAQIASAMTLPPPDAGGSVLPVIPTAAPQAVVVHDHVSLWVYALVAVLAVVATLAVVAVVRPLRRALGGPWAAEGTFDPALPTTS